MQIVITGGAGFLGRWLLRTLPPEFSIVVVDSLVEEVHGKNPEFPTDVMARAICIHCDVRDTERWKSAAQGADVVIHLAALTGTGQSMYQERRYIESNVLGTSALCEVLGELSPKPHRVILASSRAVYGEGAFRDDARTVHPSPRQAAALVAGRWEVENAAGVPLRPVPTHESAPLQPASIYGMTKMWQEQLLALLAKTHGLDCFVLRLQNVYGPFQEIANPYTGILGLLTNGIIRNGRVELFEDGEMTRDFVFVGDVARAFAAGIQHPGPLACTLNVGSGRPVTLRDLTAQIAEFTGKQPIVEYRGRYRVGDVRHAWADMSLYQAILGPWCPTPLSDGLQQYLSWFVGQPAPANEALPASLDEMAIHGLLREAH